MPYIPDHEDRWDAFVAKSRNGTFHVTRRFLSYHRDRFRDASQIVTDDSGAWLAVLPGAAQESAGALDFVSHPGLTYAGLILAPDMRQLDVLQAFAALAADLRQSGYRRMSYKAIPAMYHRIPSQDDLYALYLAGAVVVSRHVLPALGPGERPEFQERRSRGAQKARKGGLAVRESKDLVSYWQIVSRLLEGYGAVPVHSLAEITELARLFPENIRLFGAYSGDTMEAGVLIFETPAVARAQYIAATVEGKQGGALDLVFATLLSETFKIKPYFEFGTATLDGGARLSLTVCDQKEGFGARTLVQDTYLLELSAEVPTKIMAAAR